ncbi:MAG: hypothetical protein WAQ24_03180 [Candidatus Saccharimonadales bacterium]
MSISFDTTFITVGGAIVALLLVLVAALLKRRPKKLKTEYYDAKWHQLQSLLKDKATWPLAIINADKLLDEALKARKYKGKTMGERLVAAQRDIQNNDDVWFGHKLRNKLVHEQDIKLKERDVKDALLGIRHALKDLGAL